MVKESELVEGLHERAKMIVANRARRLPLTVSNLASGRLRWLDCR